VRHDTATNDPDLQRQLKKVKVISKEETSFLRDMHDRSDQPLQVCFAEFN
jgi:hypothetical protein